MIHNLTPKRMRLYITYTVDFIPDTAKAAKSIKPVRPIWMDVQNGSLYPVFDILKNTGNKGKFTYPNQQKGAYPRGVQKNKWTVDRDGVLVATAGHVHTGGLWTDMWLTRPGARYAGPACAQARHGFEPAQVPQGVADRARQQGASLQVRARSTSSRRARCPGTSR